VCPLDGIVCELLYAHRVKPREHFPAGTLNRLLRLKLIQGQKVFARPPLALQEPLATIRKGGEMPDFDALAYKAEKRLEEPREYEVFFATQRAENIFGGKAPKIQLTQMGHDIQISSVLEAHKRMGVNPQNWVSEDRLQGIKKYLPKIPDALVFWDEVTAIEVLGDYPASRIAVFSEKIHALGFTIELW
jgi:hypothetical protein